MVLLSQDRLAQTGELPSAAERVQYWFACVFVTGWAGVLCGGFWFQFAEWEYPCPLCVLQRMFMVLALLGAGYVVRRGLTGRITGRDYMTGWGMALVACVAGSVASWRQTMLHILPGDEGYGTPVFGLHLYVWAWILFQVSVVAIGLALMFAHHTAGRQLPVRGFGYRLGWFALCFAGLVIAANTVAVLLLEGFHPVLPDDPQRYQFFYDIGLLSR